MTSLTLSFCQRGWRSLVSSVLFYSHSFQWSHGQD
ncbi:hypothetical protein MPTK1_1g23470 [Marchantia polymorpha subsp. ruderalis]|uniref:Uncharacterized protein n=2 Tax=Marchantia polymorpha TaxID=3197 RepID=A0AAF6ATG8_MARPO|nr:hypothetical protein MARPO_0065s0030 [Marchantia polymorpha]BBM99738.1 hypothetical protein Mp_1g23470 [Marchantia polymorpha subsp. ruderalis]|eukprot:PTQ36217.1 hypothetical protein MARPO_0065s0030 [Marchantia polymorpha]